MHQIVSTVAVLIFTAVATAGEAPSRSDGGESSSKAEAPRSSAVLERPFTAEQIRDEWIEGLRLRIRRWTPDAEAFELWKVIGADADGVEIESTSIAGGAAGKPSVQYSTWIELRNHASFPAQTATRRRVTTTTSLGALDGWLYVVKTPDDDVVTELFFADAYPGAPVVVRVLNDGEVVETFEQVERYRPQDGADEPRGESMTAGTNRAE